MHLVERGEGRRRNENRNFNKLDFKWLTESKLIENFYEYKRLCYHINYY